MQKVVDGFGDSRYLLVTGARDTHILCLDPVSFLEIVSFSMLKVVLHYLLQYVLIYSYVCTYMLLIRYLSQRSAGLPPRTDCHYATSATTTR